MQKVLLVGIGGAIGAMLRYLLYLATAKIYHHAFPLTTFFINLTGCFVMGIVMTLILEKEYFNNSFQLLFCLGVLGGYTTLSGVAYEIIRMVENNKFLLSLIYGGGTMLLSILTCGLGVYIARHWH